MMPASVQNKSIYGLSVNLYKYLNEKDHFCLDAFLFAYIPIGARLFTMRFKQTNHIEAADKFISEGIFALDNLQVHIPLSY